MQNSGQNGLRLDNFSGVLDIQDSTFTGNGASGLLVENVTDSTSSVLLDNNIASFNGLDGFRFQDFDAATFILNDNTTSNNVGNGLTLTNFANTATNGLNILNHIADSNVGAGIDIDNGNGKLNILIPTITNNGGGGILITDFTNVPGDFTVISGIAGNQANITGNGNGPNNVDIHRADSAWFAAERFDQRSCDCRWKWSWNQGCGYRAWHGHESVSYTHLTLPTIYSV